MKRNHKKNFCRVFLSKVSGFTLIELLIVFTLISILSAVIIAFLSNAKDKGSDAAIKSNLVNAAKQAEIFYNVNTVAPNSYTSVCTNGMVGGIAGIGAFVQEAVRASSLPSYSTNTAGSLSTATCNDSASAWAAEVPLTTISGQMWCVDSLGRSSIESSSSLSSAGDYTCD